MKKEIIIEIIVFLFAVLFLYAAGNKLTDYNRFIAQIGKSPILTDYARTLAWIIPTSEILIVLALLIPRTKKMGIYAAFALMNAFTFYIIAILSFSKTLPCSCGGVLNSFTWTQHLIFNIFFVILGAIGILLFNKRETTERIIA